MLFLSHTSQLVIWIIWSYRNWLIQNTKYMYRVINKLTSNIWAAKFCLFSNLKKPRDREHCTSARSVYTSTTAMVRHVGNYVGMGISSKPPTINTTMAPYTYVILFDWHSQFYMSTLRINIYVNLQLIWTMYMLTS